MDKIYINESEKVFVMKPMRTRRRVLEVGSKIKIFGKV